MVNSCVNGGLYRGSKPVLWSVVEQTALAEAEVEYHDHRSTTVWVRFPIVTTGLPELVDAAALIWTTTPWTLPGNRAIAFSAELDYVAIRVDKAAEGSRAQPGETLLVAGSLTDEVAARAGIDSYSVIARFPGSALAGTVARHPLAGQGYEFNVPLLAATFVEADQGTGLVHIAPGHGADDFELGPGQWAAGSRRRSDRMGSICQVCRCSPAVQSTVPTDKRVTRTRR